VPAKLMTSPVVGERLCTQCCGSRLAKVKNHTGDADHATP